LRLEPLEDRAVPANFTAGTVAELISDINTANASAEADTISLVAGQTFTLTEINNMTNGVNGLPVVVAEGGPLTILGTGNIIQRSMVAGTPQFRILAVDSGATLELENLTLQGGVATSTGFNFESCQGGAVYNKGALLLDRVTIRNNTAIGNSGGPAGYGGFIGPSDGMGGGIYSNGVLSVANSTITENTAIGGVGIKALTDKSFPGGIPEYIPLPSVGGPGGNGLGGGICIAGGTASISDTSFSIGIARGGPGGDGFLKKNNQRTNSGDGGNGYGGGVYVQGGSVSFHGVTMSQNAAVGGEPGLGPHGKAGKGIGGGLYILADANVGLDAFTVDHLKKNDASTSHKNILGDYDLIS
jgi:hypothetical protein